MERRSDTFSVGDCSQPYRTNSQLVFMKTGPNEEGHALGLGVNGAADFLLHTERLADKRRPYIQTASPLRT